MKSDRFWLALLLALVLLSCAAAGAWWLLGRDGATAVVMQDGAVLRRIELDRVFAPYTFEVGGAYTNTVSVEPGRICVSHADCPDKICVQRGWISERGAPIVCLPNGLVIEIEGGSGDLDASAR